ncbi:SEC-C metal-binding domain-containing protein [Alicyclobacillus sp. SO9]|uniref:SEC-C metal-binding domain-containing protein n=1 Tax=Alicyclobacillus sp. SO9 TaxID=2665646 RepID=UPI0018E79B53|nr:SEC-C metal-binding domain-containing protein [Alicyclobacillus sp. SO9]QQE80580.1 SEC-C domain-containing protein [Alicyclobacillus sp. SO9]
MDKQWSGDDESLAPEVRERMRAEQRKAEAKLWPELEFPLSLPEALMRLTKNELSDIRSTLSVPNASSLNKQDLVNLLKTEIPVRVSRILGLLDEDRYGVLKRIATAGGKAYVDLHPFKYEYFKLRGLAFTGTVDGKRTVVMPIEVLEAFRTLDSPRLRATVRQNTEWLQLSQGLLFYYGYVSKPELIQMVENYTGTQIDAYDYFVLMYESMAFGYNMELSVDGFKHEDVANVDEVLHEHEFRPNLPFYPFTKSQLLRAGVPGFVDENPAYKALVSFLRNSFGMDMAEAEDEAEFCVYEIQHEESLAHIVQDLSQVLEIPSMEVVQKFMEHLVRLHNHTRLWFLKGHTPTELAPEGNASGLLPDSNAAHTGKVVKMPVRSTKVGRNEPCPCGSGKKYKKCCGR